MSEQHDSGAVSLALEKKISKWDYDKSIAKMRALGQQWSKITTEVARELYLAKGYLTSQKGQHRDPSALNYIQYTWNDYCEEIGLSRQVADYWIKKYIPREISKTGRDVLLIKASEKTDTAASRALIQSRIDKVLRTGKRPDDWGDEEEVELKRQIKNAQMAELAEKYNAPVVIKAKDYFSDAMRRSKDIVNFKLDNREQIMAQVAVFSHIDAYLETFDDPETRARAAFNLALKTRNRANELAELNFQLSEAEGVK